MQNFDQKKDQKLKKIQSINYFKQNGFHSRQNIISLL